MSDHPTPPSEPPSHHYQGPAILIPEGMADEYAVSVLIRHERHVEYLDHEGFGELAPVASVLMWTAEVDGHEPAPPYGRCVLRIPNGHSEGRATFIDLQGDSGRKVWRGKLTGHGIAPVPPVADMGVG
ncbi:hypothetical protein ACFY19_20560 [Streptosporangium saharense]|uniref:hypothetical protein n=1 Tax=Streptosporangium saharense TaxID=1706840 RepID=UPI0036AA228E